MTRALLLAAASVWLATPLHAQPSIPIVAAEGFYGEAAAAIGGGRVSVESVIVAAGTDPHDFDPPASVAKAVSKARIVIMNGAGYDPWMEALLAATANPDRVVVNVARLIGVVEGDNPHVWFDPKAMPAMANAVTAALVALDPNGRADFERARNAFLSSLAPVEEAIAGLRARYAGTPVVATEPVFGYMVDALGLEMQNQAFQTATMNETEPPASAVAAMEDAIGNRSVKVLFYNSQVEDAFTRRFAELATSAGVSVVAVTETQPVGMTYAEWMLATLDATAKALGEPSS